MIHHSVFLRLRYVFPSCMWTIFLKRLAEKIGKIVRVDHTTVTVEQAQFTRISVEVDLTKPLFSMLRLHDRIYMAHPVGRSLLLTFRMDLGCMLKKPARRRTSKDSLKNRDTTNVAHWNDRNDENFRNHDMLKKFDIGTTADADPINVSSGTIEHYSIVEKYGGENLGGAQENLMQPNIKVDDPRFEGVVWDNIVSRQNIYLANPGKNHWEAVKWILKYLRGIANVGLVYGTDRGNHMDVTGFVDSDYAKDPDKGRSITGYTFLVQGCVVSWKATLQHVVALSTTEAEYMALTEAVKEAIWLRGLLEELGVELNTVAVNCDNQGAIHLSRNHVFHERTKHINVRYHFIREVLEAKTVKVLKVGTEHNAADALTKVVPGRKLQHCLELLKVGYTTVSLLVWNVQGAGSSNFFGTLKEIVRINHQEVIALVETHLDGDRAQRLGRQSQYDGHAWVDAEGHSGGDFNETTTLDERHDGAKFTWTRGKTVETRKAARLDRGLCNLIWLTQQLKASSLTRIAGLQKAIAERRDIYLLKLEARLRCEHNNVLAREEELWFQKSRMETLRDVKESFCEADLKILGGQEIPEGLNKTFLVLIPKVDHPEVVAQFRPISVCNVLYKTVTKAIEFVPSRGTRQADPLSPYLFVVCMERLNHFIEVAVESGHWKPRCCNRGGPKLTNLFFADHIVLFTEESRDQAHVIKSCLQRFCDASGEIVSFPKSRIYFTRNVPDECADKVSGILGIDHTDDLGYYLRTPTINRRDGGLGIRSMKQANADFLTKLGWRMLAEPTLLWSQVLRSKYCKGRCDQDMFPPINNSSNVWQGLVENANIIRHGTIFSVGNARRTLFWDHCWATEIPLSNMTTTPIPIEAQDKTVEEYWNINGTHNALKFIRNGGDTQDYRKWEIVWKAPVSERIRMFIWLALLDRFLTNSQRVAWRLIDGPRCTRCESEEESLDHILRRCPLSYTIWNKLSTHPPNSSFWMLPLCEWIMDNLETNQLNNDYKRQIMLAITIWWLWKWRNNNFFGRDEEIPTNHRQKFVGDLGVMPSIKKPINMYCDNFAAIIFANDSGIMKGARHFLRRYHYVREQVESDEIKILKVHTDDNLADPFTKALPRGNVTDHANGIGLQLASSFMHTCD
ncbi:retrovirus-related pol polyprotein from transposon TNT 1-94 [Tanacetum coccineum]